MANHTQRETRTGYPTFGLFNAPTGATTGRGGVAFDSSGNPSLIDTAGNTVLASTTTATTLSVGGTTKALLDSDNGVQETLKLPVAGGSASSGVFASILNPWGVAVIIMNRVLRVTTQSTGAATVDIGVAADATTSNDGLIDGASVASAGLVTAAGSNGSNYQVWGATSYLNVAEASGDVDGLVGNLYVSVVRV